MKWITVDVVALALAVSLFLVLLLVGVAIIIVIITAPNTLPRAVLGENTTQVLTGAISGIIGVLGSYIGHRLGKRDSDSGGS